MSVDGTQTRLLLSLVFSHKDVGFDVDFGTLTPYILPVLCKEKNLSSNMSLRLSTVSLIAFIASPVAFASAGVSSIVKVLSVGTGLSLRYCSTICFILSSVIPPFLIFLLSNAYTSSAFMCAPLYSCFIQLSPSNLYKSVVSIM